MLSLLFYYADEAHFKISKSDLYQSFLPSIKSYQICVLELQRPRAPIKDYKLILVLKRARVMAGIAKRLKKIIHLN